MSAPEYGATRLTVAQRGGLFPSGAAKSHTQGLWRSYHFLGLSVNKESLCRGGGWSARQRPGARPDRDTPAALDRLLRKLGGEGITLRFKKAGPRDYGILRRTSRPPRSIMYLYLPRYHSDENAVDDQSTTVSIPRGREETILVTEDDPDVSSFTVETLRELGYSVVGTVDSHAAQRMLDAHRLIALLFTDVRLPGGMNGRQLADEAQRAQGPIHQRLRAKCDCSPRPS